MRLCSSGFSKGREVMDTMTPARFQAEEEDACMVISPNPNNVRRISHPSCQRVLLGSEFLTPQRNLLISMDTVENQVPEDLRKLKQKRGKGKKIRDVCFKQSWDLRILPKVVKQTPED